MNLLLFRSPVLVHLRLSTWMPHKTLVSNASKIECSRTLENLEEVSRFKICIEKRPRPSKSVTVGKPFLRQIRKEFRVGLGPPIDMKIKPSSMYDQAGVDEFISLRCSFRESISPKSQGGFHDTGSSD